MSLLLRRRILTARKTEAHWLNAQQSGGPRTARGKARVSQHGLMHDHRTSRSFQADSQRVTPKAGN